MRSLAPIRLLVSTVLFAAGLAYGCGRTSLDDGFIPADDGSGGTGGVSAQGGRSGAGGRLGQGGAAGSGQGQGGIAGFGCADGSSCVAGQVCCLGINPTAPNPLVTMCAPVAQCAGTTRFVLCGNDAACPATLPSCCVVPAYQLGVCVRRGMACVLPGS